MSKHLKKECLYQLPSGNAVHPCRLIIRDGTLMWKHALLHNNEFTGLPETEEQEQSIIKTAQRLEELNTWISQDLEPWECLTPYAWFDPNNKNFSHGSTVYFNHSIYPAHVVYEKLKSHVLPHETMAMLDFFPSAPVLYFKRLQTDT